jgi:Tol biopolymer transport system component
MDELRPVLEHLRDQLAPPAGGLEQLIAFRDRRRRRQRLGAALVATAVAVAGLGFAILAFRSHPRIQHPFPAAPASNGLIAFDCGYQICTVQPDGSRLTDLIQPYNKDLVVSASMPVFSPEGSKIAFVGYNRAGASSGGGANYDIYLMNADGTGLTNLTTGPEDVQSGFSQSSPRWSPDGSMIAYEGDDGLYVMNADGSDQHKIADGASPTWSPDGSRIAFVMGREHGADLWTIHPDGTGLSQLTKGPAFDELPAWSPDGSRIAFVRESAVYVVNADGTGLTSVADLKGVRPFQPQWSPDGSRIAFEADNGHDTDIYVVNADGTGLSAIAQDPNLDENWPVWSLDGNLIAYAASNDLGGLNDGTWDLFVMKPDGGGVRRLTRDAHLGAEFDISWGPVPGEEVSSSPTATASSSPAFALDASVARRIDVGATAGSVAAADGSVWVATYDNDRSAAAVVRIDAATNRVLATIPIEGFAYTIAAGDGAVWVSVDEPHGGTSLVRIDEQSNRITGTVPNITEPIVVDTNGVWAVQGSDIVRIDPDTLAIEARIPLEATPFDMASGSGSIWVLELRSNKTTSPLVEIDAATSAVSRTVELSGAGVWIAADSDGVWVNGWRPDGTVTDFFVLASGGPPQEAGSVYNFRPFAVAQGRVWFVSGPNDPGLPKGGICGLNVSTHAVDACAQPRSIVDLEAAHDPAAYEPVTNTVWVGEYESSLVTRIDVGSAS